MIQCLDDEAVKWRISFGFPMRSGPGSSRCFQPMCAECRVWMTATIGRRRRNRSRYERMAPTIPAGASAVMGVLPMTKPARHGANGGNTAAGEPTCRRWPSRSHASRRIVPTAPAQIAASSWPMFMSSQYGRRPHQATSPIRSWLIFNTLTRGEFREPLSVLD